MTDVPARIRDLIRRVLDEDIGSGDITSRAVLTGQERGAARVVARQELLVAGLDCFRSVFLLHDETLNCETLVADGDSVASGAELARLSGSLRSILEAERTGLNLLQRLCGIATMTARFVAAVGTTGARIMDTRKTSPGLRILEKYAVRVGGGLNHRFGLDGGVLIKENHIRAAGSIAEAVRRASAALPPAFVIEVEATTLDEVREALASGAGIIMLDNMDTDAMAEAVRLIARRALVEASGGVTLERVPAIARTGVDFISVGALTHSAPAADISLLLDP